MLMTTVPPKDADALIAKPLLERLTSSRSNLVAVVASLGLDGPSERVLHSVHPYNYKVRSPAASPTSPTSPSPRNASRGKGKDI